MGRAVKHRIAVAMILAATAFAAAAGWGAQTPPTGEPLAIESTALVPLGSEASVSIVAIRGQITVDTRDERELRVISRAIGTDGAEIPVGIWQEGSKLIVAPAPGDKGLERQLHVEVPRSFAVVVDAVDSEVLILATGGRLELRGTNLRATVNGNGGSLDADLKGGTLGVFESNAATLRLRGTTLDVGGMTGNVNVLATGGTISIAKVNGSTDVEIEDGRLLVNDLPGPLHVKAQKGDAIVAGLKAGAELKMSQTPLRLKDGAGDITVTSDASVEFQTMAASMHVDLYGGSLRGKGNQGTLEVRTRNTEVNVEAIAQGMRVQGDGLKAKIEDVGGQLSIEATISDVVVDRVGSAILKIDRGTVTVQRAQGAVQAAVTGGDVHLIDGSGPVTLDLDGGDAEVSWASMPGDKDSRLTNLSGDVTVRLPASGPCRIDAKTQYGRIDSNLPTVRVTDDRTEAQGPVNGGNRPLIRIVANGDIHLTSDSGAHDAN